MQKRDTEKHIHKDLTPHSHKNITKEQLIVDDKNLIIKQGCIIYPRRVEAKKVAI